jgi:hypothetical protein
VFVPQPFHRRWEGCGACTAGALLADGPSS